MKVDFTIAAIQLTCLSATTFIHGKPPTRARHYWRAVPGSSALLVGQTRRACAPLLGLVPTRPSQSDPDRVATWELHRREVGARIRALREARGLTQEALALASGVTRNVLIDVEHGKRGLLFERLFDIAEALQVPAGQLLGD